ncbi:TetR family transcriptional regulator [Epidermidibacterium keratini]|uniref:TetR family transcriptional regulator n=1 Tax=Epidermidibacterium keratini TaxID=1891644 RepID=A0A7L4YKC9_9ACTN|nr:TetR/AcrR family transcriptional regulator [Epidermidibacterium keratini]QHB98996.1 TetR family transcriptional regulator [Epidermidibacterium keratini]
MGMVKSSPLTADDWIDAALRAIAENGVGAVAVEPLAKKLGTTKGSFYWHFSNRDNLLERALATWERDHTDAIIAAVDDAPTPRDRLKQLLERVFPADIDALEVALLAAAATDPRVRPALTRVTQRRTDHVAKLYRAAGMTKSAAHRRAVIAMSVYLGRLQLAFLTPNELPSGGAASAAMLADLESMLAPSESVEK